MQSYSPADSLPITNVSGVVGSFGFFNADFADERKDLRDTRGRGMLNAFLG